MKICKLFLLFVFTGLGVQAGEPLSLEGALSRTLENNYGIQIARQEQRIAEIQNTWGSAGRFPYIDLTLGEQNTMNINESGEGFSNRFTAGVNLSWTLFDGYAVRISKQRFEELEQLSKQNTAIMVESTVQAVVLAYYAVLLEHEKLTVIREIMELSADRYEQAKERQEFGTFVTYDVLQAQNAYLSDRSAFLLQQVAWKNALRDLNYLMAEEEPGSWELTEAFLAEPVEYTLQDLQSQLFENNKTLQNQYVNQQLLENAVAAAKSAFLPSVGFRSGITGTALRNKNAGGEENWTRSADFYGNFTLSMNLFSGGNRKRALQIARIDEETGMVEIEDMRHELTNSLANLFEYYLVRKELLTVAEENLNAARLNLQISGEKFEAGAINSFNFRDVQNIYLNAAQEKLEAVYDFIDTHTALLRMTGRIVQEHEAE